ncbi:MAG: TetR family transcriptional regulator [Nitriliruptoraceae bacterium]
MAPADDRTAKARIRDAAITRFARDGLSASVKDIAADAGVSAPLVIHHFGSKDGLRAACDTHVVAEVRTRKRAAMSQGLGMDVLETLRAFDDGPPLLGYLARVLADDSAHVGALVDELVDDAVEYMELGVASGLLRPTEHPRERAIVLTIWQLGAVAMHHHVRRLLGVDLTEGSSGAVRWGVPAGELLANGLLTPTAYAQWREAVDTMHEEVDDGDH